MPFSEPDGKQRTLQLIRERLKGDSWILDVGPGSGTYAHLLVPQGFANIDAVEIHEPYIERFHLRDIYKTVYVGDICTFSFPRRYDLVILGDVLEHISVLDAQRLVERLHLYKVDAIFSVPWMYPQGAIGGNEAERHLQPDLTHEVMQKRYPLLQLFHNGPVIGLYHLLGRPQVNR